MDLHDLVITSIIIKMGIDIMVKSWEAEMPDRDVISASPDLTMISIASSKAIVWFSVSRKEKGITCENSGGISYLYF